MRRALVAAVGVVVLGLGLPNAIVWLGGYGPVTDRPARVPHAQAALVLGAQVKPDGTPSLMADGRGHPALPHGAGARGRRAREDVCDVVTGADPHLLGAVISGDGRASWGN
jgi:hypothetical protein